MRYSTLTATALWGIMIAAGAILPRDAVAQVGKSTLFHDLHFRIETAQAAVRVGDAIKIRLIAVNQSSIEQWLPSAPPHGLVSLFVYDEVGNEMKSTGRRGNTVGMGPLRTIAPGQELTLLWWKGKEWGDLRDWGYDLRTPGKYRISAVRLVRGIEAQKAPGGVTSTDAEITIQK